MSSALALAMVGAVMLGPSAVSPTTQAPQDGCVTSDVSVTWGFKESFRSYISGSIALGKWSTSGDVGYDIPHFTFSGGEGYLAPDRRSGDVAFEGQLVFTAHGGILRTSLNNPRLAVTGPREATLFIDVTGDTMELLSVSSQDVDFVRIRWSGADEVINAEAGTWDISGARVTLSNAGANAFGTYVAGEIFDPMDISFAVSPDCLRQPPSVWWWVAGGVAVFAGVGAAIVMIIRRARKLPEPGHQ